MLTGHTRGIYSVRAVSPVPGQPESAVVLSAGMDGLLIVWDVGSNSAEQESIDQLNVGTGCEGMLSG